MPRTDNLPLHATGSVEGIMNQDRRSFLKSAGSFGAATMPPTKVSAEERSSDGGKLSELNRLDATELAARISQRKVSPVEVIDAALTRLEATQRALSAFVAIDSDGARRAAR